MPLPSAQQAGVREDALPLLPTQQAGVRKDALLLLSAQQAGVREDEVDSNVEPQAGDHQRPYVIENRLNTIFVSLFFVFYTVLTNSHTILLALLISQPRRFHEVSFLQCFQICTNC